MDRRPGCLGGILRLAVITAVFDWLQDRFGFGRGFSCAGFGCGMILLFLFIVLFCGTCAGIDWLRLGF
jgi:apolipoprotein N-acyltransferase